MATEQITLRPFRNTDSPRIAEVWCAQPPQRGLAQPMSSALFEEHVVAKPYFDRNGLIVACNDTHTLGFVHAAFGPADDHRQLSTDPGVILMLQVRPHENEHEVAAALIERAEEYLLQQGSTRLLAGGAPPLDPFYTGLYGGAELPGILASDERATTFFSAAGYQPARTIELYQRTLSGYRSPMDRQFLMLRRSTTITTNHCPKPRDWWDAWTKATCERTLHALIDNATGAQLASVITWSIEPLASTWGVHAVGLLGLEASDEVNASGKARFLVSEVLKSLEETGSTLAGVNVASADDLHAKIYADLGFESIDQGVVLSKTP